VQFRAILKIRRRASELLKNPTPVKVIRTHIFAREISILAKFHGFLAKIYRICSFPYSPLPTPCCRTNPTSLQP